MKVDKPIDESILMRVLFQLVKNREKFSKLTLILGEIKRSLKLTPIVLFNYLMLNSDTDLRLTLVERISQYSSLVLLSRNIWDLDDEK